jgi:hypothetical protein
VFGVIYRRPLTDTEGMCCTQLEHACVWAGVHISCNPWHLQNWLAQYRGFKIYMGHLCINTIGDVNYF